MSPEWVDAETATRRHIPKGTLVKIAGLPGKWEILRIQVDQERGRTVVEVHNPKTDRGRTVSADRIEGGVRPARTADRPDRSR